MSLERARLLEIYLIWPCQGVLEISRLVVQAKHDSHRFVLANVKLKSAGGGPAPKNGAPVFSPLFAYCGSTRPLLLNINCVHTRIA